MYPLRRATIALLFLLLSTPLRTFAQTIEPQEIAAIESQVVELRGLAPLAEIAVQTLSREEFVEQLRAEADTQRGDLTTRQKLLRVLGRLRTYVDLADSQVEVLGAQVVGVYNQDDKQVALIDGNQVDVHARVALAHEITHALQDQHFDLEALIAGAQHNADREIASRALAEGDAVMAAWAYANRALSEAELQQLDGEFDPNGLSLPWDGELGFVYRKGAAFVRALMARGGWDAVNAAYRSPPQSSEQVLHPDKYLAHEAPAPVVLGDASLGTEWRLVREDILGELGLQLMLRHFLSGVTADQAAAGWRGDRFRLFERDGDGFLAFVLNSTWDSAGDAQEFFAAYANLVTSRYGSGAAPSQEQATLRVWSTPAGIAWLETQDNRVVLAIGPELRHAESLARMAK